MKTTLHISILFLACFLLSALSYQHHLPPDEICDNALDDDGDGLIDLNDEDCDCPEASPVSLIPNPSFEDMDCCPSNRGQMLCASTWIQASAPTTDYIHTCDWIGWEGLPVPLPIADGEGCVGFRNGRGGFDDMAAQPNWKEYAGACLLRPLEAGISYRFQFHIGFTHSINSPPTNVVFYGATSCDELPFGNNDETFGCPANSLKWRELGRVRVSGTNEWILTEIDVTPTQDIAAMVIGPDCEQFITDVNLYYFLDNLVLAEQSEFDFGIKAVGNPCENNVVLNIAERDTLQYQWYKDGIALVDETNPFLNGLTEEGNYQVRLIGPNSCEIAKAYPYEIPSTYTFEEVLICDGTPYPFDGGLLTESGLYRDTLKSIAQCDSIVEIYLDIAGQLTDTVYAQIFESESWTVGNTKYTEEGQYDINLPSSLGCDSLIHLILDFYDIYIPNVFSPNFDGHNDVFTVFGGEDIQEVVELQVFDRWGGLMYEAKAVELSSEKSGWDGRINGEIAGTGVYIYQAKVIFNDGKERVLSGSVLLMR